jgi:hypothetical protein
MHTQRHSRGLRASHDIIQSTLTVVVTLAPTMPRTDLLRRVPATLAFVRKAGSKGRHGEQLGAREAPVTPAMKLSRHCAGTKTTLSFILQCRSL